MFTSTNQQPPVCKLISFFTLLFACWNLTPCPGDVTVEQKEENGRSVTVYRMEISPAAAPVPAFKHRFTVPPHLTVPGNAATHYLQSFGERSLDAPWQAAQDKFGTDVVDWIGDIPISQLPLEKVREAAGLFDSYVKNHLQRATRCRDCDWGMEEESLSGVEAIGYLFPSVQQTRSIARVLRLRTRLAIAEGRYDAAVEQIRMTYQLGRNVGQMKFLVANLVGIAEIGMAHKSVTDFIARKDSPNLYWALAELPDPMVDLRESTRLELSLSLRLIPELLNVETAQHTESEWNQIYQNSVGKFVEGLQQIPGSSESHSNWLPLGWALASYSQAKQRLIDASFEPSSIETMTPGQVLMIAAARDYQIYADEYEKGLYLPLPQSMTAVNSIDQKMNTGKLGGGLGVALASTLLPALEQVRVAQLRIERQRCALMTIEAIRMHLAETGALPKTLDDIQAVPVPLNPFTNRPFEYRVQDSIAILNLPDSDGASYGQRFELRQAN